MSLGYAIDTRETEHVLVVTFRNWKEYVLYDTRTTPYDIPFRMERVPVETINVVGNLTIIEVA